jgi:hypothetical protein
MAEEKTAGAKPAKPHIKFPRIPSRFMLRGDSYSSYWGGIAFRIKLARYLLLTALIIFLVVMIFAYHSDLTLENLQYMMRYLNTDSPEYTGRYRTIYFNQSDKLQVGSYKGELAVVDEKSVTLYNMLGNSTLTYSINMQTPMLLTSDRYMLVYGLGENTFTVSNAFSKIYSETLEYPIWGASISDNLFAIVSNTMEYRSAVTIYDSSFRKISVIYKDKLVMDTVFRDDSRVAMLSVYNENGGFMTELMIFDPRSETPLSVQTLQGEMGCRVGWLDGGGVVVLTDSALHFYDRNFEPVSTFDFEGKVPQRCALSPRGADVVFSQNIIGSGELVVMLDREGNKLSEVGLDGQILDLVSYEDRIYALFDSKIIRIRTADGGISEAEIESGGKRMLRKDALTLIVAYSQRVKMYRPEELFPEVGAAVPETTAAEPPEAGHPRDDLYQAEPGTTEELTYAPEENPDTVPEELPEEETWAEDDI